MKNDIRERLAATADSAAVPHLDADRQVGRRPVGILIGPPIPCGGGVTIWRVTAEDPGEWFHCGVCHTEGPDTGGGCPACENAL